MLTEPYYRFLHKTMALWVVTEIGNESRCLHKILVPLCSNTGPGFKTACHVKAEVYFRPLRVCNIVSYLSKRESKSVQDTGIRQCYSSRSVSR